MILGIGTDLVDVRRIENLMQKYGLKFLEKTFTESEILASERYKNQKLKAMFFAKRFSAKESFSKAVGCGFGDNIKFLDLSVENDKKGKPTLKVEGHSSSYVAILFPEMKIKIDLSLSDEYPMALAFVVISSDFLGRGI
jgi:holo-[acyl-carrier protein] synthase